jgi:hypothetical protein
MQNSVSEIRNEIISRGATKVNYLGEIMQSEASISLVGELVCIGWGCEGIPESEFTVSPNDPKVWTHSSGFQLYL